MDSGLLLFYGVVVEWGVWDWIWGRGVVGVRAGVSRRRSGVGVKCSNGEAR
ncbi:MAG TPA: hypothetical protein PKH93_04375 [Chitinophagales bacterium]|nr:hypothetical protein [Chitinophagales bacterium]